TQRKARGSRRAQSRGACSAPVQATSVRIPLRAISGHATCGFRPRGATMKNNTLAIALASLLVGGVAVAAFQGNRDDGPRADVAALSAGDARVGDAFADDEVAGRLEYASVVAVDPITEREAQYATVIGSEAIRETTTTSSPREVCEDVV